MRDVNFASAYPGGNGKERTMTGPEMTQADSERPVEQRATQRKRRVSKLYIPGSQCSDELKSGQIKNQSP
jgi:hypothetical protein